MIAAQRRALIVGNAYHGKRLAVAIAKHSGGWSARYLPGGRMGTLRALMALAHASVLVCVGGPGPHSALSDVAQRLGIGVVVIWMGADLANIDAEELALAHARGYVHLAGAPWLVEELRALGVHATHVPTTHVAAAEAQPFPMRFRALAHVPRGADALSARRTLRAIANALPHVAFSVIGRGEPGSAAPPNVTSLGYVDALEPCIDAHCVVLRFARHDGMSPLVLAALARGRHVVWNYPLEGVRCAPTITDAITALSELEAAYANGLLRPNGIGQRMARERFAPDIIAERLSREFDAAASAAAARAGCARRVAVSGSATASARIASVMRASALDWDARLVRTRARLSHLAAIVTLMHANLWYTLGPIENLALEVVARVMRKPRVVQWSAHDARRYAAGAVARWCVPRAHALHLADARETVELLASCGIVARVAPPPISVAGDIAALPRTFTLLLVPAECERAEYERLLRACADMPLRVLVVGGVALRAPRGAHVERLAYPSDVRDAYARSTVLVHLSGAQPLPSAVLEALAHGRHVIAPHPCAFVRQARTLEQIRGHLQELIGLAAAGALEPQENAALYVRARHDPSACLARIVAAWNEATGPAR